MQRGTESAGLSLRQAMEKLKVKVEEGRGNIQFRERSCATPRDRESLHTNRQPTGRHVETKA